MTTARYTRPADAARQQALAVEINGLNPIDESERQGHPRSLFWPWFAANVSVLGVSYGSFLLGFGISFWQATIVAIIGIVVSFLFCGFISLAGKRGSAPTLTLSRAPFGVEGNRVPSVIAWLLTVGWETVLVSLAVLATSTVFGELGRGGGTPTKVITLIVVVLLVIGGGVFGFHLIMRMQVAITIITAVLTILYIVLVFEHIDFAAVMAVPNGQRAAADRRIRVHDDRIRARLGAGRRRLLPLPAALGVQPRRGRLDHVRRLARPGDPRGVRAAAGGILDQAQRRDRATTRSGRSRASCRCGSSSRSRSSPCSA